MSKVRTIIDWYIGIPDGLSWPLAVSPNIPGPGDPIPASSAATLSAHRPQHRYPPPRGSWINSRMSVHISCRLRNRSPRQERAMAMRTHLRGTRNPRIQEHILRNSGRDHGACTCGRVSTVRGCEIQSSISQARRGAFIPLKMARGSCCRQHCLPERASGAQATRRRASLPVWANARTAI